MASYILFLLFLVAAIFWLILTNPAHKSAAFLTNSGPLILIVAGGILTLFRRGVIGVPMIILGISWWRRNRLMRPSTYSSRQKSTVRSTFLEMELDHDTGEIDGRILTGPREGALLSSLTEEEVLSFYISIRSDADSVALLESFLDRHHPGWQERFDRDRFSEQKNTSESETMTRQEAFEVLGVEPGASREEIHQAYRRLIKGVHPDSGGSAYLTAKINAAKDLLLG